jgi:hypothetical protein
VIDAHRGGVTTSRKETEKRKRRKKKNLTQKIALTTNTIWGHRSKVR